LRTFAPTAAERHLLGSTKVVIAVIAAGLLIQQALWAPVLAPTAMAAPILAAAPQAEAPSEQDDQPKRSPEEIMNRRFPQPARVGDLIGLPVLDYWDSTIGYVRQVVRTPGGKIQLVVPYGRALGWVKWGGLFDWNRRLVAVPIEAVAILGRQIVALEMSREEFDSAPELKMGQNVPLDADEMIKIALGRR
jgi:hypothetical protein